MSVQSGITLPPDIGCLLQECTIQEIESAVLSVAAKGEEQVREESARSREFAVKNFSRERFSDTMRMALLSLLQESR